MSRDFQIEQGDVELVAVSAEKDAEGNETEIKRNLREMKALREEVRGADDFDKVNDVVHAMEAIVTGVKPLEDEPAKGEDVPTPTDEPDGGEETPTPQPA